MLETHSRLQNTLCMIFCAIAMMELLWGSKYERLYKSAFMNNMICKTKCSMRSLTTVLYFPRLCLHIFYAMVSDYWYLDLVSTYNIIIFWFIWNNEILFVNIHTYIFSIYKFKKAETHLQIKYAHIKAVHGLGDILKNACYVSRHRIQICPW